MHRVPDRRVGEGAAAAAAVTSGSPRWREAAWGGRARRAGGRGRRPSRPLRSRCCWSPGRWGSTARRARPGPGTPGGGRGQRSEVTIDGCWIVGKPDSRLWRSWTAPGRGPPPAAGRWAAARGRRASTPS